MKKSGRILSLLLMILMICPLFFMSSYPLWSNDRPAKKVPHRVPEITSKIKIDGNLGEEAWKNALILNLEYEVEPGENIKPPVKTEVLLTSSAHHLYVAFRAYDPEPAKIRARYTDRDNIQDDDHVGIVLDTFNDSRLTYNFYCNPYGIQEENVTLAGGVNQWDAIWNSAGRITKEGYIVEMEIPFSALRFQRQKEDQVWGIDVVRSYPRSLSHIIGLFPRDRDNNCYMCQAEKVIGFKESRPGKNLEFDPTLSGVLTQERESFPDGEFSDRTKKVDPGLTARWRFTPNLTLTGAVNPDFSHVEADAALLDVNTPFVLIYPEKRPFFLEDGNLFSTILNVIYTRRVADPDWGLKITGKEGRHSIGFFSLQDNRTTFVFPWSHGSTSTIVDMKNISTVMRYSRDLGRYSTVGVVVTDREGDDYYNRVVGLDTVWYFTRKDFISAEWLTSWTQYPDQVALDNDQSLDTLKGNALYLAYGRRAQLYGWFFNYQRLSPEFRADLGTNSQVDYEYYEASIRYTFRRNPGYWFTLINLIATYDNEHDTGGTLNYDALYFDINYLGPLQSFFDLRYNIGRRSYLGRLFDDNWVYVDAGIRPSGNLYVSMAGIFGDRIDYFNVQSGNRIQLNPVIEYKWGRHLTLSLDHLYEKLNVEGGRLYTANLSNFKMVYQFNRRLFLRTVLQYADFNYNPDLFSFSIAPEERHLFSQVLLSYKVNPQTVLFLGYSDDYYGYINIPLKQNNRTFFLKIGYALVL
jgi:hypothetical protein